MREGEYRDQQTQHAQVHEIDQYLSRLLIVLLVFMLVATNHGGET